MVWLKEWFVHWLEFYYMVLLDLERAKQFHERLCNEECHCFISDNLPRAAVNFAMLYLEVKGTVPVSKGEIREGIKGQVAPHAGAWIETREKYLHWQICCVWIG